MHHVVKSLILLAGVTLLAGCATTPQTRAQEVTYEADGQTLQGYLALPATTEKRPAVLVVHEWWGHNDYARKRARMLADLGYVAFAVDMYGDGKTADHPKQAGAFAGQIANNIDVGEARFNAALDYVKQLPAVDAEHVAAIGYCFGGGIVLHMARVGTDLDGVVSYHGSLKPITPAEPGQVKAQVLVFNGGADPMVKPEDVAAFAKEMEAAGAAFELVNFPGVKHSFTNPEADQFAKEFNLPLAYDADADAKSWAQSRRFFEEIFAP